jgi:hypothetical protein
MAEHPASVESQVAFINEEWRERDEVPHIYDRRSRLENTTRRDVTIHNARPRDEAGELTLDGSGFVIERHATAVTDFRDKHAIADVYFPEMRALIMEKTGAVDAFPVQFYQVRSSDPEHFFDAYSLYMHIDFSLNGWTNMARHMIKSAGSEDEFNDDEWDFALYNMWRPVGGTVEKDPLVLIDASTLDTADIVNYSAVKDRTDGLAALPIYNAEQRLYYVPFMEVDEVLIFKQLDSRAGRAIVCPHTSFRDPTAAPDARDRESIDIRMVCVFPKA